MFINRSVIIFVPWGINKPQPYNQALFNDYLHASLLFTDLSRCQRTLAKSLNEFNFECIGSTQTDDEQVIADSLKQFSKLISAIEDERDNMVTVILDHNMFRFLISAFFLLF